MRDPRSFLPSVEIVLQSLAVDPEARQFSHKQQVSAVRRVLQEYRQHPETIPSEETVVEEITARVIEHLQAEAGAGIRRVVNATGIVLHTGLGRAVLPREATEALQDIEGCSSLQFDLETGLRGRRDLVIEQLIQKITGAEAATIVGNNAGATLIVLAALAGGKEVIVSRGQLIEIGGSFRLPDVIRQSGARMVETGTTNKTHLRDYESAITEDTSVLMRVNPSNYRIIGFSQQVETRELASLAHDNGLIMVDDLGCGALVDLSRCGLPKEPTVQDSLAAGADIALFSGDKLIGGPQSGIIVGRKDLVQEIRKHPLARALRVGKLTIAAMEATLKLFLNPETLWDKNPTLHMLSLKLDSLRPRAEALAEALQPFIECEVMESTSACGGGALPNSGLPTAVVALNHKSLSADQLARHLRLGHPPVAGRIQDDRLLLDTRTLLEGDNERILQAVRALPEF